MKLHVMKLPTTLFPDRAGQMCGSVGGAISPNAGFSVPNTAGQSGLCLV